MTLAVEQFNRRLLRARNAMDRTYAEPLDIPRLAAIASLSEKHFIRSFRATFGETPHRYRQRAPVAMAPTCFLMAGMRPSTFGEADSPNGL